MTRLKDATFEAGSLTGTDGFTSTTGTPALNTSSVIKGANCAEMTWVNAQEKGTVSGISETELYVSFYFRVTSLVAFRLLNIINGATQINLQLDANGRLRVFNNTTNLFNTANGAIAINTTYRIGVHVKVATASGNSDEVVDVYLATGDADFGTSIYSASNLLMNTNNNNYSSVDFGNTNSTSTSATAYYDDIRIDTVSMPAASTSATDYPQTVNVTVTGTVTRTNTVGKTIAVTVVDTISTIKSILKPIQITITNSISVLKTIGKLATITVTEATTVIKNIGKTITNSITVVITRQNAVGKLFSLNITDSVTVTRNIMKAISYSMLSTIAFTRDIVKNIAPVVNISAAVVYGRSAFINAFTSITITPSIQKTVGKLIPVPVNTLLELNKAYSLLIAATINATVLLSRNIATVISIIENVVVLAGKNFYKVFNLSVFTTVVTLYEQGTSGFMQARDFIYKNVAHITTALLQRKTIRILTDTESIVIQDKNNGTD
jgi:hypothetical protein